jgi:hypothetical protein
MRRDAKGRLLLTTGVLLVALAGCKKKSDDAAPAASQVALPSAAPAASIAPATEPSDTAQASASAAAPSAAPTPAAAAAAAPKATASAEPAKAVTRTANTGYLTIQRCCNALAAAAKKPGLKHNRYQAAAAVCSGIAAQAKKGNANPAAARTTIRAQLQGVPVPGGC